MNKQFPPGLFLAVYLVLVRKTQVLLLKRQNTDLKTANYGLIAGMLRKANRCPGRHT